MNIRDFLLAFFVESENKPLLVGILIGLSSYLLMEVKAGTAKPIYMGACCVLGGMLGYFITPFVEAPASKAFGLEGVGKEGFQTLLSAYLAFKNLGIVTWIIKKADRKLEINGKDN